MKVLEINNNKGYYVVNGEKYEIIDIDKDNLFKVLNVIYESDEEIKMDEECNQNKILNEAEKVIYNGIYQYLVSFINERSNIKKEIDEQFFEIKELLEKKNEMDSNII